MDFYNGGASISQSNAHTRIGAEQSANAKANSTDVVTNYDKLKGQAQSAAYEKMGNDLVEHAGASLGFKGMAEQVGAKRSPSFVNGVESSADIAKSSKGVPSAIGRATFFKAGEGATESAGRIGASGITDALKSAKNFASGAAGVATMGVDLYEETGGRFSKLSGADQVGTVISTLGSALEVGGIAAGQPEVALLGEGINLVSAGIEEIGDLFEHGKQAAAAKAKELQQQSSALARPPVSVQPIEGSKTL